MIFSMVSASAISSQLTSINHVFQTADLFEVALSNPKRNLSYFPCKLHVNPPVNTYQLLEINRRDLAQRTLGFSVSKRNDESKRDISDACIDDSFPSEDKKKSRYANVGGDMSIEKSLSKLVLSADQLPNEGSLLDKLKAVHLHVLASEQWNASRLKLCQRNYMSSATNLIHYVALKSLDIDQLKEDLSSLGLLNLEIINSNVLASLNSGIRLLENLQFNLPDTKENDKAKICTFERLDQEKEKFTLHAMKKKASLNRQILLGTLQEGRTTHIMVTIGQEAIESETLITDLLKAGTSIVRINCAHGEPSSWSEIIRRVKRSSQMLEMPCRILMDLAGPKLRTDQLKPGPCVIKISPKKNATGNTILPSQVWLSLKGVNPPHLSPDSVLFIDNQEFLAVLEVGDTLRFCDARGRKRALKISRKFHVFSSTGFLAECDRTAYVQSGTKMIIKRRKGMSSFGKVVDVPARESYVRLRVGDLVTISRDGSSEQEESLVPTSSTHRITCSSGYLFDSVKPGEPIAFDDGKIWGVIQGTSISEIVVSITHAGLTGTKLGSEKSINIPESNIRFEGLTSKDLKDLEFVASHADMVGISFVRNVRDITVLRQELEKRRLQKLGIVLKIETRSGFEKLPLMLIEAMNTLNPLGVMIARGDLAVECGWERLADIQEEILAICSAAHVPVIWATQVLESLVKSGVPTRAEITDVGSGRRASCVMLNKGKHIVEAVTTLDKILHSNSKQMKPDLKPLILSSHLV